MYNTQLNLNHAVHTSKWWDQPEKCRSLSFNQLQDEAIIENSTSQQNFHVTQQTPDSKMITTFYCITQRTYHFGHGCHCTLTRRGNLPVIKPSIGNTRQNSRLLQDTEPDDTRIVCDNVLLPFKFVSIDWCTYAIMYWMVKFHQHYMQFLGTLCFFPTPYLVVHNNKSTVEPLYSRQPWDSLKCPD